MDYSHIEGIVSAPFTPMKVDGSLNLELVPSYYEILKRNGAKGAFVCGSTGEGASLTLTEKKSMVEAWSECAAEDRTFSLILFLGGNCVADSIELATHAKTHKFTAVSMTSPSYFKPSSVSALAAVCHEVASVAPDMPFYYYHIPVLTGVNFPMIRLLEAVEGLIPNFAGIKYTHEDFMDFQSCLSFSGGKYDMLWGRDENMLAALSIGAKGFVGSTYNYMAPLYHQLLEAFENEDLGEARQLQQVSINLIGLLGKYGGMGTGKAFMKLVGLDCGEFRLPVDNMSTNQFTAFQEETKQLDFFRFASK